MIRFNKTLARVIIVTLTILSQTVIAHDYLPGEKPDHPILLQGGKLFTISGGVIENGDILIVDGRISQIGVGLTPPEGTEIIELNGQYVYPGLIAAVSSLGLVEIGAVRATRDNREIGRINPNVRARIAYNPDSEIIPSVRANGVTTALVIPGGSLLTGVSSLMNLDGWTWESCTEKAEVAMHLVWPGAGVSRRANETRTPEKQKKAMAQNRRLIYELFDDARSYYEAQKAGRRIDPDSRWEAMIDLFDQRLPLFIHANDYRQIQQAVTFASDLGLTMVLVGGADSWMLTDLLKANDIPVILINTQKSPPRHDDPPELAYQIPGRLEKAGIKFCLSTSGASGTRRLNLQPAQAVPYGLTPEMALRSITLSAAEILGVAADLGSIEVGKKATLVISEGDILDLLTHKVTRMYIGGRPVDLDNKHKELFRKYSAKRPQ